MMHRDPLPDLRRLDPRPRSLDHISLPDFPLQDKVRSALAHPAPSDWEPTGLDRSFYLDVVERIVRAACGWRNDEGAIIDPVEGAEFGQTSPRFAAPGAILLHFGRCEDIRAPILKTMDYCCRRLAEGQAASPDFWMRELMTALSCLGPRVKPHRVAEWEGMIASVAPESIYQSVDPAGENLEDLNNWNVYAAAGESMRQRAGLGPGDPVSVWGDAFFDKYMPVQLTHFTENGMYRDPNDPITYDITTRLQFATALAFGYDGALRADLNELLRRGALTQLLFVSPDGHVPFGGRSSQYQFQEAIIAALSELEARRYAGTDDALAGAFKRQAHISAKAISRWLKMNPFRHIKNGYPPETSHGIDGYGRYSVYSLLTASFFGLAALFADDDLDEFPCAADAGGYAFELAPAFHKVFCSCGDTQVEIDTRADFHYDATGLGRFTRRDVPIELGPGMPITSGAIYKLPERYRAAHNCAIGPTWRCGGKWHRLADFSEGLTHEFTVESEDPYRVEFVLIYRHADAGFNLCESCSLEEGRLDYQASVRPANAVGVIVPLLTTDGAVISHIEATDGEVTVAYRGAELRVCFDPDLAFGIRQESRANRNGLYKRLVIERPGNTVRATLWLGEKDY
jgi:hypothetical protein